MLNQKIKDGNAITGSRILNFDEKSQSIDYKKQIEFYKTKMTKYEEKLIIFENENQKLKEERKQSFGYKIPDFEILNKENQRLRDEINNLKEKLKKNSELNKVEFLTIMRK